MSKYNSLKAVKNLFGDVADGLILGISALALCVGMAGVAMAGEGGSITCSRTMVCPNIGTNPPIACGITVGPCGTLPSFPWSACYCTFTTECKCQ